MKIRRIVVRLDPAPRSRSVLEAAAALAEKMEAELVGLFVENMDLVHFAGFPFAREVGFPSAMLRPLDVEAMERSLRDHAREARDRVKLAAERGLVNWSFRVERAAPSSAMPVLIAESDLVVAHLSHMDELCRDPSVHIVRAGDVTGVLAGLDRGDAGILVLAGSDDALMGRTLRQLHDEVNK